MTRVQIENEIPIVTSYRRLPSPLGEILVAGDGDRVSLLGFQHGTSPIRPQPEWEESLTGFPDAARQIEAYFRGELKSFDLEVRISGTPFQGAVWRALTKIPYGTTVSYREVAVRIGNPRAVRAVGLANARNPVPLLIPCHRVVGVDGGLTGYRGGIEIKRRLLELERARERRQVEQAAG